MFLTLVGVGQDETALSLMGSMCNSPSEMIKPRYLTDVWLKEHFTGHR